MKIEILGTGCPKCKALAASVERAVAELGLAAEVVKVTDINEIVAHGVMLTPALAVNGEVVAVGKVPSAEDLKKVLGGKK